MSNSNRTAGRNFLRATLVAALLSVAGISPPSPASAAGVCALVPNERAPSENILQCGEALTVRPAPGARYRLLYRKGDPLPVGIRLDDGAVLIEFHPTSGHENFQILTPLAIAAVRGTKWAVEVVPGRTSAVVLAGSVAVTNRRLNQYVVLTWGQGIDITAADTSMVQKLWGQRRVDALLSRFGE
jgi:hypothetical protein